MFTQSAALAQDRPGNLVQLGEAHNGLQMGLQFFRPEFIRQRTYINDEKLKNIPINISVRNNGATAWTNYSTGNEIGIGLYTLDDHGQRIDLLRSGPPATMTKNKSFTIRPGETKNLGIDIPKELLANTIHGWYATLIFADASGQNAFELSSGAIDVPPFLAKLTWGEVTNGAQVAIEIPYVEQPAMIIKNISFVSVNIFVRAAGDKPLYLRTQSRITDARFVTQDDEGALKDLVLSNGSIESDGSSNIVQPGEVEMISVKLPADALKDIRRILSIRIPIYDDPTFASKPFGVSSQLIDAREINEYIKAVQVADPALTLIPEANLNPLPAGTAATSTSPGSSPGPSTVTVGKPAAPKPAAKPSPPIAQAESPSYAMPALIALGVLIVAGFFLRRRK